MLKAKFNNYVGDVAMPNLILVGEGLLFYDFPIKKQPCNFILIISCKIPRNPGQTIHLDTGFRSIGNAIIKPE